MVGGNIAQQVFSSISISIYVYIPHIYMNRNMYITSTCGDEAPGDSIGTIMKNLHGKSELEGGLGWHHDLIRNSQSRSVQG